MTYEQRYRRMNSTIDDYSFGAMTIGGTKITTDLILLPNGTIVDHWWRTKGHHLTTEDIRDLLASRPDKLIIGTGAMGLMKVSEGLLALCEKKKIAVESCRTSIAVNKFNQAAATDLSVGACFHLTC